MSKTYSKCDNCQSFSVDGVSGTCLKCGFFDGDYSPSPEINDHEGSKSEVLSPGIDQIPFESIEAIGAIFTEGEIKYGRDNWKKDPGNVEYTQERTRHAIRHLWLWANGDRSENHLAKVAWFCVTTLWREKNAPKHKSNN